MKGFALTRFETEVKGNSEITYYCLVQMFWELSIS